MGDIIAIAIALILVFSFIGYSCYQERSKEKEKEQEQTRVLMEAKSKKSELENTLSTAFVNKDHEKVVSIFHQLKEHSTKHNLKLDDTIIQLYFLSSVGAGYNIFGGHNKLPIEDSKKAYKYFLSARNYARNISKKEIKGIRLYEIIYAMAKGFEKAGEEFGLTMIDRGFNITIAIPFNETMSAGLQKVAVEVVNSCPTAALSFINEEK